MAQYDPAFTLLKKDKKEETKEQKYDPAFTVLKPEDYSLSGVEFEAKKPKPQPKQEQPTFRMRGESLTDPNADWWEQLQGAMEIVQGVTGLNANISGADVVEKAVARDIPKIPFVREAMKDFAAGMTFQGKEAPKEGETAKRAWNDLVGGGIEGIGETLADPRSYAIPKIFNELGRKTTWSAKDLEYWKDQYIKSKEPINKGYATVIPSQERLMGTYDPEGVGPITSLAPRFPKKPSGGRFLASPSGVANIRNPWPLVAAGQAGELSPPIDPTDTSRFPRTINEGTPSPAVIPESSLSRPGQPPATIAPPSSPIEEVLALSKTGQKPVIKSRTELDGTTRVWVNDNEYTHLFGLGGATAQDIKQLHFAANDPKTFIRMEELKRQNEVGTPYGPVTKFEAERQAQVSKGLIDPNRPGEASRFGSRGNVAIFGPSTNRQVYEIADELASVLTKGIQDDPNVEKLLQEAEVAITQERDPAIIDDNLEQIKGYLGTAKSPDERELFGGLYDTAREKSAQSQATPGAVVRPRFKNLPKKSKFKGTELAPTQPAKPPSYRMTADGQVIDLNTGETMSVEEATKRSNLPTESDDDIQFSRSRQPKYAMGEPRNWEPIGTTPQQVEDLYHKIAREMEDHYNRPFSTVNFTQMQSYLPSALAKVRGKQGSSIAAKTGNDVGTAFHALDYAARLNLMRSYQAKLRGETDRPRVGYDDDLDDDIQHARTPEGNLIVGADAARGARLLSKDYSGAKTALIIRENFQNAGDVVKALGSSGEVKITMGKKKDATGKEFIRIEDNGKGLTTQELETVMIDIYSTGKEADPDATGGKGVGKAIALFGGESLHLETVALDGGKKIKLVLDTTPDRMFTGKDKEIRTEVPDNTPTGTKIEVTLGDKQEIWEAQHMANQIMKYSRGLKNKMTLDLYGYGPTDEIWNDPKDDTFLGDKDLVHSDVSLSIPKGSQEAERKSLSVNVLNNGIFQFSYPHELKEMSHGIPNEIIVNVKPKVDELHDDYPFPLQRESFKANVEKEVGALIDEKLGTVGAKKQSKVQEIYDNMESVSLGWNPHREAVIFDPGNRLTRTEKANIVGSPVTKNLIGIFDSFLDQILQAVGDPYEINRLEKVGIFFPQTDHEHGIHVPNPSSRKSGQPKSAIMVNWMARIAQGEAPEKVAEDLIITLMHEYGHVGKGKPSIARPVKLTPTDLSDPRVAKFLDSYRLHVHEQGGVDIHHGIEWLNRLGDAYEKMGAPKALQYQNAILDAISDTLPDGTRTYNREVQKLLSIYIRRQGRAAVTEDYLSGTAVKHESPPGREGGEASNVGRGIGGTTPRSVWDETGAVNLGGPGGPPRYDSIPRRGTPPSEPSAQIDTDIKDRMFGEGYLIPRAFGLVKGLVATGDLPPLLRQGGAYAGRKFWRQAAKQQFRSYASEGGHQRALAEIRSHELMQPQANGMTEAEEMGLDINAGRRGWGHQEEAMMGIEDAERLVGWMTRGKINPVKASNRAFHDTMDYLRLEAALQLKNNYRNYYNSFRRTIQTDGDRRYAASMNPASPVVKKRIGELVNSTSGRARFGLKERRTPKDIRIPGTTRWVNVPKPLADIPLWPDTPGERFAGMANLVLFSGRLAKSYVERYNRLLNPYSYMKADPVMRREYLKQLLSIGGARVVLTGLGAAFGGLLGTVATSSDWGKSVMPGGKIAMDTTLGGGKYETFAARVAQGEYTNRKGETKGLGEGPYIPTGLDLVEDLGEGLASPAVRAAIEVLRKSEHFSGPQAAGQELGLRSVIDTTTPIIGQDMWDIIMESPEYIPLLYPDAIGVGLTIRRGE